MAEEHCCFAL